MFLVYFTVYMIFSLFFALFLMGTVGEDIREVIEYLDDKYFPDFDLNLDFLDKNDTKLSRALLPFRILAGMIIFLIIVMIIPVLLPIYFVLWIIDGD